MINIETVLIIGAGASKPFGFPIGRELVDEICSRIENQGSLFELLGQDYSISSIEQFAHKLRRSGEDSIDAFLEYQDEPAVNIGKTAIAAVLLPYEVGDNLFTSNEPNWYQHLWAQLRAPFEDFEKSKISIITFNYDRSLEHYLFTVLKNKYHGKSDDECAKKLGNIPIIHVYGKLGPLSWESTQKKEAISYVPYNSMNLNHDHSEEMIEWYRHEWTKKAASSIIVLHESNTESQEFKKAREIIRKAQQLFFLGFGYHEANLTRLGGSDILRQPQKVQGTAYNLSYVRIREVERLSIRDLSRNDNNLANKTVYNFLYENVDFNEI